MQQYFDHFALANKTIQERLGTAPNALNKLSALYGMQARGIVQMLSYGNDMTTTRAASHLLNMDIFRANDAYLLKLGEGFLLNSIESITPPLIHKGNPFIFASIREYDLYDSIGSITLRDGSSANLVIYGFKNLKEKTAIGEQKYEALYCAGQYVSQNFVTEDIDLTPGTFQAIYVPETYKAIWTPSIHITLEGIDQEVTPIFSMSELLAYTDKDYLVLCQHTARGLVITLGDGEVYGAGYNNKNTFANITAVRVSYIKTDSLAEARNETIAFNSDVTPLNANGIPVLDKPSTGDTPDTFRSRAVAETFASGKITNEKDLVTEIKKIPLIKSCAARREQNYLSRVKKYDSNIEYPWGSMVESNGTLYIAMPKNKGTIIGSAPSDPSSEWQVIVPAEIYSALQAMGLNAESAFRYDNATILLSGLIVAGRRYWEETHNYIPGDICYHAQTGKLYVATANSCGIPPGSDPGDGQTYWISQEDLEGLQEDAAYSAYRIDDYVPITQAIYELELKGYFGLAPKLGFTSVVVEPCIPVKVEITCQYVGADNAKADIARFIQKYACYNVGKCISGAELHTLLTQKFGMRRVYITVTKTNQDGTVVGPVDSIELQTMEYVAQSTLFLLLTEAK